MKLTRDGIIQNSQAYIDAGYKLPTFDYEKVSKETYENPSWIHFGAGNIFRAFQANVVQNLLQDGTLSTGLIAVEGFDYEIIEKMYLPHDNLSLLMTLRSDNTVEKTVVGSIMESLILDRTNETHFHRLENIFAAPSLQMASFTITEKGYALTDASNNVLPYIEADFAKGPGHAESYLGKVVSLLYTRFVKGALPIAMVSMDNCSHNGDKLAAAVFAFADAWCEKGFAEKEFSDYVKNPQKVSFPWSMIDKITPRPDEEIAKLLSKDNIEDLESVVTSRNTFIAPFVNAEECEYLVIEDLFPNGRPALEKGGIIFTNRETVDKVEKMKVCTCLNPLHTTLAIYGCLLGYDLISEEMKNPYLKKLVEKIGYEEGLPVVINPGIIEPKDFIDEVVNKRIPNPFLPDTPQRIATDTSQKLGIRFGETIKAYEQSKTLDVMNLKFIPLVLAGWLRYLMAVDDNGISFEPSSDPLLSDCTPYVSKFTLSNEEKDLSCLDELLQNEKIFGINLESCGLSTLVKSYFLELSRGTGAVAKTLEKYLSV
ncbi:mannitol dehydrogenase family protein [Lachnospiraceae bacterium OttesenSCG-928-D06]|nr:mannitol dehydrogenase family protein [Lachnospiraceae bacterium OttesenSCG-928-D06]